MSQRLDTTYSLRTGSLVWILIALALTSAPHAAHLPLWISGFCLLLGIWRALCALRGWRLPATWLRFSLTGFALAGVYFSFSSLFGRDGGVALLLVMLSLKLLEMRTRRDAFIVIVLTYFVIITGFLYSQTIFMGAYMLVAVIVITSALIDLHRSRDYPSIKPNLQLAGKLLAPALPVMLMLFVLFPRVSGPLWGMPEDAYGGVTGLDDKMAPGQISRLAQSDAVAFRVAFTDAIPPPRLRYWRGPVLWDTDGAGWRAAPNLPLAEPLAFTGYLPAINYSVTLEPHHRTWLFALDLPASVPPFALITSDLQLYSKQPVHERLRYTMNSYTNYNTGPLPRRERQRALQAPADGNPRLQALAQRWRAEASQPAQVVQRALDYFRTQPFFYTLEPPLLTRSKHPMDSFLFETRRGFCEHYASAFALLMRAAGIPARIVTGYQGGELNPMGDYLIVRQSDAHAWVEVWLQDRGWVRTDPTAAVSPARIERGVRALPAGLERDPTQQGLLAGIWHTLRLGWDRLDHGWNQWVLGYDHEQQQRLFDEWGLLEFRNSAMLLAMALSGCITLSLLLTAALLARRPPPEPAVRYYRTFCERLARRGVPRMPAEGPTQFAARAAALKPRLAPQIGLITQLYTALRYGAYPQTRWLTMLRQQVRKFRP